MKVRTSLIVLAALLSWVAVMKAAQFETPSRAFHNAYGFRLDGRHQTVACEACHINQQFRGTPTTCYECHWVRRKDDRYQTRLGTQCEQCHRSTSWTAVQWDHGAVTGTRLNLDHRQLGCQTCHGTAGNFRIAAMSCVSCHRKDYDATRAPAHAAAGFPVTCEVCHSAGANAWQAAGVNHSAVFPLVGLHASQACETCHKNNVFAGTPRDCVGCHQADYSRTQNPNHVAAGFPTTCDSCHRAADSSWLQGTFNHTRFPLRGSHNVPCAQCHTTPGNVAVFNCTICHDRAQTDGHHREVRAYRYDSVACYSCHPTGRGN